MAKDNIITSIRGFHDVLPEETPRWHKVLGVTREIFSNFGFSEILTPLMERTELFARGIGDTTDVVEKEMFTMRGRGGESSSSVEGESGEMMTLRPEATAGIIRSWVEHHVHRTQSDWRVYCIGPMFRYERPQKGRQRQFYQIDAEIVGTQNPMADAEIIFLLDCLLRRLRVPELTFVINSIGCPACRPEYHRALGAYLEKYRERLSEDSQRRLETNVLRILDSKLPQDREVTEGAPGINEFLCDECDAHYTQVKRLLGGQGVEFEENSRLVRGLDYYTKTTFEVISGSLGAQNAVVGGGRYDHLAEAIGGPFTPAIGFAMGVERLISLIPWDEVEAENGVPALYLATASDEDRDEAFRIRHRLVSHGLSVAMDYEGRGLRSQMKKANRMSARYSLVLGERERQSGRAALRNMNTGEESDIDLEAPIEHWRQRLSR